MVLLHMRLYEFIQCMRKNDVITVCHIELICTRPKSNKDSVRISAHKVSMLLLPFSQTILFKQKNIFSS